MGDDGAELTAGAAAAREAGFRAPAGADAIRRLASVTAELAAANTMDEVIEISVLHTMDAARAAVSVLLLADGDHLVIASHAGVGEKIGRWTRLPIEDDNPACEAFRTRLPTVAATAAEVRERYPRMAADTPAERSVIGLPLNAGEQTLGVIGLTFDQNWRPGNDELDFLMLVADTVAQTIRRVRATDDAERRAAQLRFLADASAELSRSLDYSQTLSNVAHLAVPDLADWCAVDLRVDDSLTTLAVAHADPKKVEWAWQLRDRYPPDNDAPTGLPNVVRTGHSELYATITDAMLVAGARDDEHLRLSRELNLRSVMIVPLLAGRRSIGAITFIRTEGRDSFTENDLAVAQDLGRRAGTAIENARLHELSASVALQFQHAVLPEHLDAIPGWEVATYYSPNGQAEVGGDFFDAVAHPDGSLSVFIGDVVGHGVQAAAAMAQIRAAVRAYLTVDPDPEVVIGKTDRMFEHLDIPPFVTLLYMLIRPDGGVRLTNAGHYPPLVVSPGGQSRYLAGQTRPPIGVRPAPVTGITDQLGDGDVLLLYTDGVVERRDETIEARLKELADVAATLPARPLAIGVAALVRTIGRGEVNDDDVAVIAVRVRPS